jgi:hypothetical protein
MSKWAVILLLVPLFDFNQAMVGAFDFQQYLLCVWILFAMCLLTHKTCSFDVLPNARCTHDLLQRPCRTLL